MKQLNIEAHPMRYPIENDINSKTNLLVSLHRFLHNESIDRLNRMQNEDHFH